MKKISNVWTLIYKEENCNPLAFIYYSEKDAKASKLMVEDSDGDEILDNDGNVEDYVRLEWCYLINGKLIEPNDAIE